VEKGPSGIGIGRCRRIEERLKRLWPRLDGMLDRLRGAIGMIGKSKKVRGKFVNKANQNGDDQISTFRDNYDINEYLQQFPAQAHTR
jgi:hypothetical protein